MAQTEDTELRDLVIDALEKNGSLAKIRALLRANVFLVFEEECENMKQNPSLDNILKQPEGVLCLSIVHEFLEFCNLKNTLFVYMAESRQKKEYIYEGQKKLAEKLNISDKENEPILISLLKQNVRPNLKKHVNQIDIHNLKMRERSDETNYKDDQNCTYIVHEDSSSSATSNSQSDNSSDEKNKLHLQLPLDNSDTDTSSDSTRDKSHSEYIPHEHVINSDLRKNNDNNYLVNRNDVIKNVNNSDVFSNKINTNYFQKLLNTNSSSDSTSYVEIKPYNPQDEKLLNTSGVPFVEENKKSTDVTILPAPNIKNDENIPQKNPLEHDSVSSETLSSASYKIKDEIGEKQKWRKSSIEGSGKSEAETPEYSNDFSSSPETKNRDVLEKEPLSPESIQEEFEIKSQNTPEENQHNTSQSSQSSISISDVADLISDKSSTLRSFVHGNNDNNSLGNNKVLIIDSKKSITNKSKLSDDSAEFSESPVPSLSNLSLDIHSD